MNYFSNFPVVPYTYRTEDGAPYDVLVSRITSRTKLAQRLQQVQVSLYDYIIADDERPDTVSMKLYNTVSYTWIILVVNNILSLYDWPLTETEMASYLRSKYGSLAAAREGTPYYSTIDGDQVDAITYTELTPTRRGAIQTPYEYEVSLNEAKRRIKVVSALAAPQIANTLRELYR